MNEITLDLQNKISHFMQENMPIKSGGRTLAIEDMRFVAPTSLNTIEEQLQSKYSRDMSLKGELKGKFIVTDDKTGKVVIKSNLMKILPIYHLTDRGTYLVKGVEKNIVSQMRLRPGVYSEKDEHNLSKTTFRFNNKNRAISMPPIAIEFDPGAISFKVSVGTVNFGGINFLRALEFSDPEIGRMIGNNNISDILFKNSRNNKSLKEIYSALTHKTAPDTTDKTRNAIFDFISENGFFEAGNAMIKANLGLDSNVVDRSVIARAVAKTFEVARNETKPDNKDDMRFKPVFSANDLIMEKIQEDFNKFKKSVEEELKKGDLTHIVNFKSLKKLGEGVDEFMTKNSLSQASEQTNPVHVASIQNKVTQMGAGGLDSKNLHNITAPRNLKLMGFNRLDPIETPESSSIGLDEHMTQAGKLKNKTIYIPLLKVSKGVAIDAPANITEVSPEDEFDMKVAFYDSHYVKREGNKITFIKDRVPTRYKGQIKDMHISEVEYVDSSPHNLMNIVANMIPFVGHDDGNRALMGTNYQNQAVNLVHREIPLVQAAMHGTSKTYEEHIGEKHGRPVRASVDGIVKNISEFNITVMGDDKKEYLHPYYHYFPLNQAVLNNEVVVKVGDRVKAGSILAEGWQTRDGKLALGVNARVGYMAYKGHNYEDGVVVSESLSRRMSSEEISDFEIDIKEDWNAGRGSGVRENLKSYTTDAAVFSSLDGDGIIKVGLEVNPGSTVAAAVIPIAAKDGSKKNMRYRWEPLKIPTTSYVRGIVKRVTIVNNPESGIKQRIFISLLSQKPLKLGDKLSGKHGNKGTVTKILPDHLMPVAEDGKSLDLMFSPLAVPSRKNLGQLLEANAGLIAEKTGKNFIVDNFDHKEKDRVAKGLKDIGFAEGKMKVSLKEMVNGSIKDIQTDYPVTVGNMYLLKLKHKVDDKVGGRSNIEGRAVDAVTYMPAKETGKNQGEKHNPQRLGEMEMRALQAHGAIWNILESSTVKSDGGGDTDLRFQIFSALAENRLDTLDSPATPQTLNVLSDHLSALGLRMSPVSNGKEVKSFDEAFSSMALTPIKPSEMIKMIGVENEVVDYVLSDAKAGSETKKTKLGKTPEVKKDVPRVKGLLDPDIFGEDYLSPEGRQKWGYIKLSTPVPNPLLLIMKSTYNPYSTLTGIKRDDVEDLVKGKLTLIVNPDYHEEKLKPGETELSRSRRTDVVRQKKRKIMSEMGLESGQLVKTSELDSKIDELYEDENFDEEPSWKTGGEALQHLLDHVDLDEKIKQAKEDLENKKLKGDTLNAAYLKYKALMNLKNRNLRPSDLMLHYVPVAPQYMRPVHNDGKVYTIAPLNDLYSNLIKLNNPLKERYKGEFDMSYRASVGEAARDSGALYRKVSDVFGKTVGKHSRKKTDLYGIAEKLRHKEGLIRSRMLAKRNDFSGRSVIGVDPSLKLNEIGIPVDIAKYIYRPLIYRDLINKGYVKNADEAKAKWEKAAYDPDVKEVLDALCADRPVMANRQPSLHKFNIQAFNPKIRYDKDDSVTRSIQLNPLIVTGFNADFDGDSMALHVPITEQAKEEAKALMMPSNNLMNPTNGKMIIEIRHEMALGIYYLTMDYNKPVGVVESFGDAKKLMQAYKEGLINARSRVSCSPFSGVTAGQAMVNFLIPEKYRNTQKAWTSKDLSNLFMSLYKDCEKSSGKDISLAELNALIENMKTLGFMAATRSGISIGISDFKKMDQTEELFRQYIAIERKKGKREDISTISGWRNAEKKIQDILSKDNVLGDENPLTIMMTSGARAKPDQIRRMMVSVGVGVDVNGKQTMPVEHSHLDGLSPQEYYLHSQDARKGLLDRSVSTSKPGELTRSVWSATQDIIIREADCLTREGIDINVSNSTIVGRFLTRDVVGETKILAEKGKMITDEIRVALFKDQIKYVNVRSPLKCKTPHGLCQKCYGAVPGTRQLPKIGQAIGVLASQAIGEPVMQMTLNTFHSGGTGTSLGTGRIENILDLTSPKHGKASLAEETGKITNITIGPKGTFDLVYVNKKAHKVFHSSEGESIDLKHKVGDIVSKGDFLTYGDLQDLEAENQFVIDNDIGLTGADPKRMFALKQSEHGTGHALDYTQNYLTRGMEYTFDKTIGKGNIDRRHLETIVSKLTSVASITDPGDSPYSRGQEMNRNEIDNWNAINTGRNASVRRPLAKSGILLGKVCDETLNDKKGIPIVRKGDILTSLNIPNLMLAGYNDVRVSLKPIRYQVELNSISSAPTAGHSNWFSNLGHENTDQQIAAAATLGQIDKLNDPRSRMMAGKLLNIGEGFNADADEANSISTRMYNIFSGLKPNKKKK